MNVSNVPAKLLLLATISMLPSCASSAPVIQTTEAACRDWKPITYSYCVSDTCTDDDTLNLYDTDMTVRQIERWNAYMGELCRPK